MIEGIFSEIDVIGDFSEIDIIGLFDESFSWDDYWDDYQEKIDRWRSMFDFLWFQRVTGNKLYDISGNGNNITINDVDFAGKYIPVDSTATFNCIDNAIFLADDIDDLWFDGSNNLRNVTVNELIEYDFERTIVWYDNEEPHHIKGIGILKSSVNLTDDQKNELHTDFML